MLRVNWFLTKSGSYFSLICGSTLLPAKIKAPSWNECPFDLSISLTGNFPSMTSLGNEYFIALTPVNFTRLSLAWALTFFLNLSTCFSNVSSTIVCVNFSTLAQAPQKLEAMARNILSHHQSGSFYYKISLTLWKKKFFLTKLRIFRSFRVNKFLETVEFWKSGIFSPRGIPWKNFPILFSREFETPNAYMSTKFPRINSINLHLLFIF